MVLPVKLCLIVLGIALQTGISFQDCGHRFSQNIEGSRPKRIVGGRAAVMNSWPWIVSFVKKNNNSLQYCAGSLIGPDWILTTAHCFLSSAFEFPVDHWKYIAGNHFLDKKDSYEQVLEPKEVFIHPKYVPSNNYSPGDYDIALIRLRFPVKITRQVRPICLPNDTDSGIEEDLHFVVGWGNVYDTPTYNRSNVLRELPVHIIPQDVCNGSSSYGGNVTRRQFCAGYPGGGQDACFGDSGGPLQYINGDGSWTLKGLVSWGRGCARNHLYGLYTDVKALLPYIRATMQGMKCGVRRHTPNHTRSKRIVGGKEAAIQSWPWTVNIVDKNGLKQACGGSVIDSNWILTAAHCFLGKGYKFNVSQYEYYLADHSLKHVEAGELKVIPEAIYVHPNYFAPTFSSPGDFDVCLIKLKYSVNWSDKIAPVCLPDHPPVASISYFQCYVLGWGNVADTHEYRRSEVLKELRVKEVSFENCNSNVSYRGRVSGNFFCAGFPEGGNDTCYGDSGGALQCDTGNNTWTVRGIVSWGIGCARPNYFGVYSNVTKMLPFVKAIMSGPDVVVQRIMGMTIQDISKKHGVNGDVMLCLRSLQAIITLAHPRVTSTDLVRTLAVQPELVKLLEIASPRDVALAFNWEIHATCESMTLKQMIDNLTRSHLPYRANNDTLQKIGKELNMTTKEIASLLRETTVSLLLTPAIKPDVLRQEIQMKKVIEEKVSRMECFVLELTRLQPECNVNLLKLQKVLRNYSYQIVRNMSDIAVKRVISRNQIGVFIKNILIKNLLLFFAQTWESFKGLRLRDIIVELLGVPLDVLTRDYSYLSDAVVVENTLNEVEIYWNISTVELTLEKVLTASRLMEDKYDCNSCHENSVYHILNCEVVCINPRCPTDECNSNGICSCELKEETTRKEPKIKLALILGALSVCFVALLTVAFVRYMSKHYRSKSSHSTEGAMTDKDHGQSNDSIPSKDASNNNISFLSRGKTTNGKNSSYVVLECFGEDENKIDGNLEAIL